MGGEGVCFCNPYSSWKKGGVECHNAMLRRFIAKGRGISSFSDEDIIEAEEFVNNLRRRSFGYETPDALFEKELDMLYGAAAL